MLIPKPIRKFLAIFRGDVAPGLIVLSTLLGLWFGMLPGWSGVHVILLVLALVLNVNLGAFILFAAVGKALLYAAAPLWYSLGRTLQDALEPIYQLLANLPIIGLTDYAQPALVSALLVAPVLGVVAGLLLAKAVTAFRHGWLKLDERSEKFRNWQQKSWVRWLEWLLVGKRTKDVKAVLEKKPRYVRMPGVILALVVMVGTGTAAFVFAGAAMRDLVAHQLTIANGAEVNIGDFSFTPWNGRVTAQGVQVTDPANPASNRLVLGEVTADAGLLPLLRGKLVIDEAIVRTIQKDVPRERPGEVVQAVAPPPAEGETKPDQFELPGEAQVDRAQEYWEQAKEARAILEQVAEWLPSREQPPAPKIDEPQSFLEYVYARVPRGPSARLLLRRVEFTDVPLATELLGETTVVCTNLSENPEAANLPVTIEIRSLGREAEFKLTLHFENERRGAEVRGEMGQLELTALQERALKRDNPVRFESGVGRIAVEGTASRYLVDLSLGVELRQVAARSNGQPLFGMNPATVNQVLQSITELDTKLRVVGRAEDPFVAFDVAGLKQECQDALVAAGKAELANRLDQLIGDKLADKLPDGVPKADDVMKDPAGAAGNLLGGLLGGGNKKEEDDGE